MPRTACRLLVLLVAALVAVAFPAGAAASDCRDVQLQADGGNRAAVESAALCFVNAQRDAEGLPALKAHGALRKAGSRHSRDMVRRRYFDHTCPSGSTMTSRVKRAGYLRGASGFSLRENLAWGGGSLGSARAIVRSWMRSPGHRANILARDVREAGVGVAAGSPSGGGGATYTLVFGDRR